MDLIVVDWWWFLLHDLSVCSSVCMVRVLCIFLTGPLELFLQRREKFFVVFAANVSCSFPFNLTFGGAFFFFIEF